MNKEVFINGRIISERNFPYIVAEISANHNGDINKAFEIIKSAKKAGADAVKIQTYTPETMTIDCDKDDFLIKDGLWKGYNLYDLYKEAQTPFEWQKALFDYAKEIGITLFSTPFDETAVELLESLEAPAYKVASFEATDLPLIDAIAKKKKPIILSTGMANLEEISEAVEVIKMAGCKDLVILHCISGYPTPIEEANLKTISDLRKRFNVLVGLSDHTLGLTASLTSIPLGAVFIEKHFTHSRKDIGPDSAFSLEPSELENLCRESKNTFNALGHAGYDRKPVELSSLKFRRSIYVVEDIKKGEKFNKENIRRIRPGFGIAPKFYPELLGKSAVRDIKRGEPLKMEDIE